MVAAPAMPGPDAVADAALNLLWPGFGQLSQGRTASGIAFALQTLFWVGLCVALPDWRVVGEVGIAAITLWSVVDAFVVARRRRRALDADG